MAYRASVFNTQGPGKGSMLRLIPGFVLVVFVLGMFYPFVSGYIHNSFGKPSDRSALIGQWVGVVELQPLDGLHKGPVKGYGDAVLSIRFSPPVFSFLSKLSGEGTITDTEGHVKSFTTDKFMTPFRPQEGRFSTRVQGTHGDDTLTGMLTDAEFNPTTLTIKEWDTTQYHIVGILSPGDNTYYQKEIDALKAAPTRSRP